MTDGDKAPTGYEHAMEADLQVLVRATQQKEGGDNSALNTEMTKTQIKTHEFDEQLQELRELRREREELQQKLEANTRVRLSEVRLPLFDEKKDKFDSFIHRFESFARMIKWPRSEWAMQLGLLLTGEALDIVYSMPPEHYQDYNIVRDSLMRSYALSEEGYRKEFFTTEPEEDEIPIIFMARLERCLQNWILTSKIPHTFDGLKKLILREELYKRCHVDLKLYLREKSHTDPSTIASTAQQYLDAYGGSISRKAVEITSPDKVENKRTTPTHCGPHAKSMKNQTGHSNGNCRQNCKDILKIKKCFQCGSNEHLIRNCTVEYRTIEKATEKSYDCIICKKSGHNKDECWFKYQQDGERSCFRCGSKKHIVKNCSTAPIINVSAIVVAEKAGTRQRSLASENIDAPKIEMSENEPIVDGIVNGKQVKIMRDSGSSIAAVRAALVRPNQYLAQSEEILLMDGTNKRFQKARVCIECEYYTGTMDVMVIEDPVVDCVLGNLKCIKLGQTKGGIG